MVSLLHVAIASTTAITAWECYLLFRQRIAHRPGTKKPTDVDLTDEKFEEIREYTTERVQLSLINQVKSLVEGVSLTLVVPSICAASHDALVALSTFLPAATLDKLSYGSFAHGWAFMTVCDVLSTALALSVAVYATFWLEAKHGFNKTTKKEFVKDQVKMFVL